MLRRSPMPRGTSTLRRSPMARKSGKIKRKKLTPIKSLRKKVWTQFSIFIRTRGADASGFNVCATCNARKFWRELQAGHWIHGRLDFEPRNIHAQCVPCNYHWNTRVSIAYSIFMARTYGVEVMDELRLLSNTSSNKLSRDELNQLLEKYTTLNAANPIVSLGLQTSVRANTNHVSAGRVEPE